VLIGSTIAQQGFTSMGGDMTDALHRRAVERRVGPPRRPELCRSGSLIEREFRRVVLGDRAMRTSISILINVINEAERDLGEGAHNTAPRCGAIIVVKGPRASLAPALVGVHFLGR